MSLPDMQEQEGARRAGMAVARQREDANMNLLVTREAFDIAALSDEEFEAGLALERTRQDRIKQIIKNDLIEGIDFGAVPGVSKPFAWEGTADKILKRFRWTAQPVGEPSVQHVEGGMLVSVTAGIFDNMGRLIHSVPRSCSTFEKRFKLRSPQKGKLFKFDDPRECLNECLGMAFKRGKLAATLSAAGAKGYFTNPEQLDEPETAEPWTPEQKQEFYKAALKAGIKTAAAAQAFVAQTLGRGEVYTTDVEALTAALATYKAPGVPPIKTGDAYPTADIGEPGT